MNNSNLATITQPTECPMLDELFFVTATSPTGSIW